VIDAALRPFGTSSLLPAAAYLDTDVFDWETEHFFDGGWMCVGRAAELPDIASQRAISVGSSSVLLSRGRDGVIRAFANICRHRGHELLPCGATATRAVIQCPYHAWSYELDGALRLAPHLGDRIDPAEFGLVPVALEQWGGWLFVNLDGRAAPFADHVGALPAMLANWACDELVVGVSHHYELAANWKLAAENYHECYHCPLIHPELCRVTNSNSGDNFRTEPGSFVGGTMEIVDGASTMSFSGDLVGSVRPSLDEAQRRQVIYVHLFPNLLLSLHPDYVMTHRLQPLGPTSTSIECQWLFAPEDIARDGFAPSDGVDLWDLTNRQDWGAVESIQRSMASPLYRPGVLAHSEDAVYQFVAMVANGYAGHALVRGHIAPEYTR
jgi:glycine betaine catabolism A